jgi:hypothetical protein
MNKDKIEFWLNKEDETIHHPSVELLAKLKNIPSENRAVIQSLSPWILWLAAASFIGFMLFNISYLKSNSANDNSLDSYFSTTTTY